jgi:hypothetical protein
MATVQAPISDMLVTVKSREVQRGMLAEMRADAVGLKRHFLAAAHLELVLANDYADSGQDELALRSRLSAASCFWRAGQPDQAQELFTTTIQAYPSRAAAVQEVQTELAQAYPRLAS